MFRAILSFALLVLLVSSCAETARLGSRNKVPRRNGRVGGRPTKSHKRKLNKEGLFDTVYETPAPVSDPWVSCDDLKKKFEEARKKMKVAKEKLKEAGKAVKKIVIGLKTTRKKLKVVRNKISFLLKYINARRGKTSKVRSEKDRQNSIKAISLLRRLKKIEAALISKEKFGVTWLSKQWEARKRAKIEVKKSGAYL